MTPHEFRDRWNNAEDAAELVTYPPSALSPANIPDDAKSFLQSAGLPVSAAPFLDFEPPSGNALETAAQRWQLSTDYNRYHVIGTNGSGDPICLDSAAEGQVVYLNHDDDFRRCFMNSSVAQLAESLLAFRHLVSATQKRNGPDAYLDANVPEDLKHSLHAELARIDAAAMADGCHWTIELANLSEMPT